MELADLVDQVSDFDKIPPREKIQLFAWFLHAHAGKEVFSNADVRACFSALHMADPNVAKYLPRMVEYKDLVKAGGGFKLERAIRVRLDSEYGIHHSVVQVSRLLSDLPSKVSDMAAKNFLTEAIKCYRIEAYRACIVMTWNLAYSHLLHWILSDALRLSQFNSGISRRYPKKTSLGMVCYDDFLDELTEREVIEICNTAGLVTGNVTKILREKLDKRNTSAHPSPVVVVQSQADDVVTDLVNNIVLRLS
jgi:hypothetical protein